MFYLTTHSTHFIYSYMASDMVKDHSGSESGNPGHMGYSFRLAARVLLYASSHGQNNTYDGLCYTSRGALAGTRNSSMKDRSDDPSLHERTLLPQTYIKLSVTVFQLTSSLTHEIEFSL